MSDTESPLPPSPAQAAPAAPAKEALPAASILLVDDTPANLVALEALLAPLGQEVVHARSGEEALWQLLRRDFALILMDVQMPGLSGLDTARLIKQRERTRHVPIIFITALSRETAFITQGYEEGAVDYLLKPVDPVVLCSKVSVFVELHQRGERLKRQALELAARERAEEEMRRAAELEKRLLGIVGHDIRTPLASVLTTAQTQLADSTLPEAQRRAFERVARGGVRIQKVVELLLDFTRAVIGGGLPMERTPGDLNELCRPMVEEFHGLHPTRPLSFVASPTALQGEWDAHRLAQVTANLLDNAFKYGAPHSPVRLQLRAHGEQAAVLEVHNEGPPIPEAQRGELFRPFRRGLQGDGAERQSLGLGLYIVHEIVRAHGGRLEVESSAEAGTTFRVCLPRSQAAQAALPPACNTPLSLSA